MKITKNSLNQFDSYHFSLSKSYLYTICWVTCKQCYDNVDLSKLAIILQRKIPFEMKIFLPQTLKWYLSWFNKISAEESEIFYSEYQFSLFLYRAIRVNATMVMSKIHLITVISRLDNILTGIRWLNCQTSDTSCSIWRVNITKNRICLQWTSPTVEHSNSWK